MKADLHIHSIYSHDAIAKPDSILAAAADRGIGMIAVTDHDTTAGWKEFAERAPKYPVQVIWGQEVKIYHQKQAVGELLCLFLKNPVKSKTVNDVIREVQSQGGLVSIAHPFSERRIEFRAFADIDNWQNLAVEVMNGRSYKPRDNEMAKSLADRLKTPITAGSDAHTPFEVGNTYLEFDGKTMEDLLQAILNHDVKAKGKASSALFSLISGFGRIGLAV